MVTVDISEFFLPHLNFVELNLALGLKFVPGAEKYFLLNLISLEFGRIFVIFFSGIFTFTFSAPMLSIITIV